MSDGISLARFEVDGQPFHVCVNQSVEVALFVPCEDWRDTFAVVDAELLLPEPEERQVKLG